LGDLTPLETHEQKGLGGLNIKGEEEGKGWCSRNRKCKAFGSFKHKIQKGRGGGSVFKK